MAINLVDYRYHAVGQGLFSTGALIERARGPRFRWAYDCGTVSGQSLITDAMDRIGLPATGAGAFDLVAVSHFDEDHISGLAALLARFPVRRLMLPYATLAARLAYAFASGVSPASPAFRFYIDPVGYIRSLEGGERVGLILFVPPSGDEGPPPERPEIPADPDDPDPTIGKREGEEGEGSVELEIDADPLGGSEGAELLLPDDARNDPRLAVMRRGGKLSIDRVWEFVPYNNAELVPANMAAFELAVAERRQTLLAAAEAFRAGRESLEAIRKAVDALKAFYDASFGRGAAERNLISLFLFAGPLAALHRKRATILHSRHFPHEFDPGEEPGIAQFSTGDGYLDTPPRLEALIRYISPQRVARVGVFQVMHHGARRNWHPGVAARFSPLVSIFSSDPGRGATYHPHAEVLRDFWPYGPEQVDKFRSFYVCIYFE